MNYPPDHSGCSKHYNCYTDNWMNLVIIILHRSLFHRWLCDEWRMQHSSCSFNCHCAVLRGWVTYAGTWRTPTMFWCRCTLHKVSACVAFCNCRAIILQTLFAWTNQNSLICCRNAPQVNEITLDIGFTSVDTAAVSFLMKIHGMDPQLSTRDLPFVLHPIYNVHINRWIIKLQL